MFFLTPLQRFAEGVASAAMPNTKNTPEYAAFRKMQVYEEAVSEARQEGGIAEFAITVQSVVSTDSITVKESNRFFGTRTFGGRFAGMSIHSVRLHQTLC